MSGVLTVEARGMSAMLLTKTQKSSNYGGMN